MSETRSSKSISTQIEWIAELARKHPARVFSSLHHVIDMAWLKEASKRVRKDAAVGIDGQSWDEYAVHLQDNLQSLLNRFKAGTYYAPPVRRVHIPKGDGRTRPIGIPTLEDKILQRAVTMVLQSIYEQDFKECSYGFRPKRSAHDGLQVLWDGLMKLKGGYVIDADIADFFGTLDRSCLREFLDQRTRATGIRHATRGSDLSAVGEHLLACGFRRMVCTRCAAAPQRARAARSLCGRLRCDLRARR